MATFLVAPLMVFTFLSLFGLQECLVIWLTLMLETKLRLPNFFNKGIGSIKNVGKFYRQHNKLVSKYSTGLKYFCYNAYRNLTFMIKCLSLEIS